MYLARTWRGDAELADRVRYTSVDLFQGIEERLGTGADMRKQNGANQRRPDMPNERQHTRTSRTSIVDSSDMITLF